MPGWTTPGCMTVGAAQILANVHRVRPGRRALVIGINPLSISIAHSLHLAGVEVLGVVHPPPNRISGERAVPLKTFLSLARAARAEAPTPFLRLGAHLVTGPATGRIGLGLLPYRRLRVWNVPVAFGAAALTIRGDRSVESVEISAIDSDGHIQPQGTRTIPVDLVCLAGGLTPLAELAGICGCEFTFIPELGGHVPLHGPEQETTVPGLFVAGNITGVESALAAAQQGRVAGLAIARDLGYLASDKAGSTIADARNRLERLRRTSGVALNPSLLAGRAAMAEAWGTRVQPSEIEPG